MTTTGSRPLSVASDLGAQCVLCAARRAQCLQEHPVRVVVAVDRTHPGAHPHAVDGGLQMLDDGWKIVAINLQQFN
jgi:hypothetical protein